MTNLEDFRTNLAAGAVTSIYKILRHPLGLV